MPIHVHELSPADFEPLLKLSTDLPHPPQPPLTIQRLSQALRRYPGLSLVAADGSQTVGAAVMGAAGPAANAYLLLVAPAYEAQGLRKLLLDKATMKLASGGGRTCHLEPSQPDQPFWDSVRWTHWPQFDSPSSPNASRPQPGQDASTPDNAAA